MMEFFYDMDSLESSPVCKDLGLFVEEVLIPLINLHTLANKYDAKLLQRMAVEAFKRVGTGVEDLRAEDLELLVHAHYPSCVGALGEMGKAIVTMLVEENAHLMDYSTINELVAQYGIFDGDIFILGKIAGVVTVHPE
jgi:hypothetical protein